VLATAALLHCGGESVSAPAPPAAVGVGNGGSESGNAGEECDAGAAGATASYGTRAYARLRSACSLDVKVNRRGAPVSIDFTIK
jgi:hypothetical protein